MKPFYMLHGKIDLVREYLYEVCPSYDHECNPDEEQYVEETYVDENGDRSIISRKVTA